MSKRNINQCIESIENAMEGSTKVGSGNSFLVPKLSMVVKLKPGKTLEDFIVKYYSDKYRLKVIEKHYKQKYSHEIPTT